MLRARLQGGMLGDPGSALSSLHHWVVLGCLGPQHGSICLILCKWTTPEMGKGVTDKGRRVLGSMICCLALAPAATCHVVPGCSGPTTLDSMAQGCCFEGEECGEMVVGRQRFRAGQRAAAPAFPSLRLAVCILPSGLLLTLSSESRRNVFPSI